MAVRLLLVLTAFVTAFAVLSGCGQASSPVEKQEKQEGVEQAADDSRHTEEPADDGQPEEQATGDGQQAEQPTAGTEVTCGTYTRHKTGFCEPPFEGEASDVCTVLPNQQSGGDHQGLRVGSCEAVRLADVPDAPERCESRGDCEL